MAKKTKEERLANKKIRKERRGLRKEKFKKIIDLAKDVPELTDDDFLEEPKQKFNTYWPALEAVLDYVAFLRITGEKIDLVIYRIIAIGNKMYDGQASDEESEEFIDKMQQIWGIARRVLSAATVLTDDKTDELIEKIIAIGDWITSIDED